MAVIDTILSLMVAQRAESLVLEPHEVPSVVRAEETIHLPMPAVPPELARRLALEVVGAEQSAALSQGGSIKGTYRSDDGGEFTYLVRSAAAGCRIEMFSVAALAQAEEGEAGESAAPVPLAPPPRSARIEESPTPNRASRRGGDAPRPDPGTLSFLDHVVREGASDVFFSSGKPPQMRLHGSIQSLGAAATSDAQIEALLPGDEARQELKSSGSADFGVCWQLSERRQRFRVNIFRHSHGLAAALRPIRARIPSLDELQLPADLLKLCAFPGGLVLLTGASGSGKSTTLAAMIDHINRTKARHIITIEDPIEFEHQDAKSLVHQREVGRDVESFSSGLRAALRENPDVILLGEMRDLPTISASLTAAETGHLVFSTLHTGNATASINRIIDVFPGHQQAHVRIQLAASLRAVVSQRLLPGLDGRGRVPAIEKLVVTPAVANSIRDGHEHHMRSAMQTGAAEGMITLERSLATLECRGKISREAAFRHAQDPQALEKLLG